MPRMPAGRLAGFAILACLSGSLLSGCGPTAASTQMVQATDTMNDAVTRMTACTTEVANNPRYAPLARHINLAAAGKPTLQQQADPAKATPDEIAVLFVWHEDAAKCRPIMITSATQVAPIAGQLMQEMYFKRDQLVLALVQQKITWGDANREMATEANRYMGQVQGALMGRIQQLSAEHEAEMAQRAVIAVAIAQAASDVAIDAATRRRHR